MHYVLDLLPHVLDHANAWLTFAAAWLAYRTVTMQRPPRD